MLDITLDLIVILLQKVDLLTRVNNASKTARKTAHAASANTRQQTNDLNDRDSSMWNRSRNQKSA